MKNKIILSLITLFFLIGFVSAGTITQLNNVKQAFFNSDGSITYTNNPISNVGAIGFICSQSGCPTLGTNIFDTNTGTSSSITLSYPTTSQIQYYGTYFYKDGWIGYELASSGNGTLTAPARDVYLAKKEVCYAPITNLQVLNQIEPNKPLMVNVTTGIDANTYSALQNSGPLQATPSQLVELRKINTSVILTIKDSSGNIINTTTKLIRIPYSGVQNVQFNYTFNQIGRYNISVTTNVTDTKCLNSTPQTASASTQVINQNETNYTYSLIQNLSMNPILPIVNELINFSFNYISNYVDSTGSLVPINTSIYATILKNGVIINQSYFLLSQQGTNFNSFSFINSLNSSGSYVLEVRGVPNTTINANKTLEMSQILPFIILNIPQNDTNQTNETSCTSANWNSSDGICQSNNQTTRTWTKIGICNESSGISHPATEIISCIYNPGNNTNNTCTSFSYSNWSTCLSGLQSRTLLSSLPLGCTGGNPILSQSCTSGCTSNCGGNGGSSGKGGIRFINITSNESSGAINTLFEDDSTTAKIVKTGMSYATKIMLLVLMFLLTLILLLVLIFLAKNK